MVISVVRKNSISPGDWHKTSKAIKDIDKKKKERDNRLFPQASIDIGHSTPHPPWHKCETDLALYYYKKMYNRLLNPKT